MGIPEDSLTGSRDFAFFVTMNDILKVVEKHVGYALFSDTHLTMGVHLKMASRALRCALEIYGDRVAEMQKEKT
jgi:hypothetical protein